MKSTTLTSLFILASTLGLQAQTPPDLVSSFDAAAEDWRASTNTGTLTWQATHGNPDGYLRGTGPSSGWYFVSPAEWAGEWSGYQVLKFDLAVPSGHFHGEFNAGDDVTWFENITVATGPHTPVVHTTSLVSRFGSGSEGWVGYDNATFSWDATGGYLGTGAAKVFDAGTGTLLTAPVSVTSTQRFYRLQVRLNP